jgi:hypothetical protein
MARTLAGKRPPPTVHPPVGRCIYCGSEGSRSEPLGAEHIVPLGLGGDWILPRASCKACATITGEIERYCQREMYGTVRVRMQLPTRRPGGHPTMLPLDIIRPDGRRERRLVPSGKAPMAVLGFRFPPPGLLRGVPPAVNFEGELIAKPVDDEAWRNRPEMERFKIGQINMLTFARMLAQIAHAYMVATAGLGSFRPFLPDLILGRSTTAPYWVGGDPHPPALDTATALHHVYRQDCLRAGRQYFLVAVHLFSVASMPRYPVVVGEPHGWIRA